MISRSPACVATRGVVSAQLDGHASELELASAERHMAGCPACRRFSTQAAVLTATVRGSHDYETVELPVLLPARVAPRARRRRRVALQAASVAAVATLALLVGDAKLNQPAPPPQFGDQSALVSFDLRPLQRLHQTRNVGAHGGSPVAVSPLGGLPQSARLG